MPTLEQDKAIRDALRTILRSLFAVTPKSLAREAELGTTLSFAEAIPYFERIINLFRKLEAISLDDVSYAAIQGIYNAANEAFSLFKSIQDFNPQQGNPSAARVGLINLARDQYESHYARLSPVLAFAARKESNFDELEQKARAAVETANKLTEEVIQKGKEFEGSATAALNKLQEVAAKSGIVHHAVNFKDQADEHLIAAHRWFWVTVILVAISGIAVWLLFIGPFRPIIKDVQFGEIIYSVTSRLIIFSIISFAIYWAAKNHGSHRHNYIVNKHRQNALVTFQTFIAAAGTDQGVKNAVLLQAGQAIYASQPTGYSENIAAPVSPVSMVEVFKSVSPK